MAGKRKAEGIALLAAYGGDDDASQASADEDEDEESPERQDAAMTQPLLSQQVEFAATPAPGRVSAAAGALGIVDYAHDEGLALSPEPEDGEILGSGERTGEDGELQPDMGPIQESPSGKHTPTPGMVSTPQPENTGDGSAVQSVDTAQADGQQRGGAEETEGPQTDAMEPDILNDFLPPPPTAKYTGELQTKFAKYLALKKTGKSLNEQLRNTKGYRNPDFLQSAVRHYDIDHIGSCFKKETFDPHGYDQSDYYDAIALEIRREAERKELERRQTQRVDFVRSSIQGAMSVGKSIAPIVHKVAAVSSSDASGKADGRSSKKSKWDKVEIEGTRSSQTISSAADAIAAASAHAALLTASANAGAGYASFAQRRREAEEKIRASEKISLSSTSKFERKTDSRS